MRKRALVMAVCTSLVITGLGTVTGPAQSFAGAAVSVQDVSPDKFLVQYLAANDPRSTVRIAAWQALVSSSPDAAIERFMTSGYDFAVRLAAQTVAMNMDFAKRILATYAAEFAPEVHAAAQFAVSSRSDADRELFARTGFAAAQLRDRQIREVKGEQAKALVEADRTFVRDLAVNDPGEQVRVSAAFALRVGAVDSDIVDFFATGWAFGAKLDLESYRRQAADNDTRWRLSLSRLLADATAAEQAARDATADLAEQAKAKAIQVWQAVGTQTDVPRSSWSEAQGIAARQASNWAAVVAAATQAAGPNWSAIAEPATANTSEWDTERVFAAQQSQYWNSLLQQALDGEQRVRLG